MEMDADIKVLGSHKIIYLSLCSVPYFSGPAEPSIAQFKLAQQCFGVNNCFLNFSKPINEELESQLRSYQVKQFEKLSLTTKGFLVLFFFFTDFLKLNFWRFKLGKAKVLLHSHCSHDHLLVLLSKCLFFWLWRKDIFLRTLHTKRDLDKSFSFSKDLGFRINHPNSGHFEDQNCLDIPLIPALAEKLFARTSPEKTHLYGLFSRIKDGRGQLEFLKNYNGEENILVVGRGEQAELVKNIAQQNPKINYQGFLKEDEFFNQMARCKFLWQGEPGNDLSFRNIKKALSLGSIPKLEEPVINLLPQQLKRQTEDPIPSPEAAISLAKSLQSALEKKWLSYFKSLFKEN